MSVIFRACSESDLVIVQNYVLSLYQEDPPGMEMTPSKIQATFWEFTNKPQKGRIVVFEQDNKVVGYGIIVFFWSNEYGGDFIEIDELFVHTDYRGNGIGTAFFEWIEKTWAKALTSNKMFHLITTNNRLRRQINHEGGTFYFLDLPKKAVALSLQATPSNERAFAFYQRQGFWAAPNRHLIKLL